MLQRYAHNVSCIFEVFRYNEINKYGFLRARNPEIMEFGDHGLYNHKIGILLDQSGAE